MFVSLKFKAYFAVVKTLFLLVIQVIGIGGLLKLTRYYL